MAAKIRVFFLLCLSAVSLLLASCGWLSDDKGFIVDSSDDYIDAREQPPIVIPEELSASQISDVLVIPEIPKQPRTKYFPKRVPRPDTIYAREDQKSVKIQKLDEQRWLVVGQTPATVWPKLKQFLAENGVPESWEDAEAGRLNTTWMQIDKSDYRDVVRLAIRDAKLAAKHKKGRDRLLFLVEQGIRPRTTEIHILHQNDSFSPHQGREWGGESDIKSLEAEMLNELGSYMASNMDQEAVSFVAQNISTQTKAELETDAAGRPVLRLNLGFNRAWATVGQALQKAKLKVNDIDRSSGIFYIVASESVLLQKDKPGLISRLLGSGRKDKHKFQVAVAKGDAGYVVSVNTENGQPAPIDLSQQVLVLIREFAT